MTFRSPSFTTLQEYNVKDCCGTLELLGVLRPQLDVERERTYSLSRALQAPILSMTMRGIRINQTALGEAKDALYAEMGLRRKQLEFIVRETCDREFNPNSVPQLRSFLFDVLGAKPIKVWKNGESKVQTGREALEQMAEDDEILTPFIDLLLLYRDVAALKKFLEAGIDPDGRIRSYFSIPGTVTGRLSSSENAFGRGGNLQNITEDLRHLFIADPGYIMLNVDLEQADSWNIGLETFRTTGDDAYLKAILSGDLHTYVARMIWPELEWTGDIKKDRAIADRQYYRHFSYRDLCKRGGHGANYLSKAKTAAKALKIPLSLAESFQRSYFSEFGAIRDMHQEKIQHLQLYSYLTTLLGRKRYFHGRLRDHKTWRDAIGYLGQSPTGDVINLVMLRIHHELPQVQILNQIHDALLMQVPIPLANQLIPRVLELFSIPITVSSPSGETRTYSIPAEAAVGWNWGKRWKKLPDGTKVDHNPDGLDDWRGQLDASRKRRYDPAAGLLDRCLS